MADKTYSLLIIKNDYFMVFQNVTSHESLEKTIQIEQGDNLEVLSTENLKFLIAVDDPNFGLGNMLLYPTSVDFFQK